MTTQAGLWPLPENVGRWGSRSEFVDQRLESGQWVFWEDRFAHVLAGRYHAILPLHVELSPTYLCNFACPWCSCRSAREEWADEDVFSHPRATPLTIMRRPKLESVIDHLAEHGVEVMWVGGEPTMNPLLYPAAARAHEVGLNQCLFTNGSLLRHDNVSSLFDAELVFIRVSLNAVTPEVHQRHHDYSTQRPYARRVLDNLGTLAATRAERRSRTALGVSIVVDRNNVHDLQPTVQFLAELCDSGSPRRLIDYVIIRPAFPINGAQVQHDAATADAFSMEITAGSKTRRLLDEAGIKVILPPSSVESPPRVPEDDAGCLAAGWFGEITPNGDLLPCSDLYGDPDFFIGNLATDSVQAIWASEQREVVLERVRETHCPSRRCPANGRGHYLNRVFRHVETFRARGELDIVQRWAEHLREVLPAPEHSFFL